MKAKQSTLCEYDEKNFATKVDVYLTKYKLYCTKITKLKV